MSLISQINLNTVLMSDFNTLFSLIDRSSWFKKKLKLNDIIDQMNLTNIYRTFYPNIVEYAFFVGHGTFLKTDSYIKTQSKSKQI